MKEYSYDEAIGLAEKYCLEGEVKYCIEHGMTPTEALEEWDLL